MGYPEKPVVVRLLGGLGNQMFQYATGLAVSRKLGVSLVLDTSHFVHDNLRQYALGDFRVSAQIASEEYLAEIRAGRVKRFLWLPISRRTCSSVGPIPVFHEASFAYDERILHVGAPIYLDGYWQSERYFSNVADVVRGEFTASRAADEPNLAMFSRISDAGLRAVSLHVRRGDYVSDARTAQYHGACSPDYYRAAVQYLGRHVQDPCLFVFSDEPQWVRENLSFDQETVVVDVSAPHQALWDMMLMASCHHHVIANSSFSWWGAWLNPSADKIVVAPKQWFHGAAHDTRDLIPHTWATL